MQFHHLGFACKDLLDGVEHVKSLYNVVHLSPVVYDELQDAEVCLISIENSPSIELVSGNAVSQFIKRHISLYHICYEIKNIESVIENYCSKGAIVVSPPRPARLFSGRRVAFLHTELGLVELLEKKIFNE